MAASQKPQKRDPVEKVLAEFDARKEMLEEFCLKTKSLIADCLEDAQLRYQSIQYRVKRKEKLREKYLDPKKNYSKLDDITDQAGLRIITYYEDEVDRVAEVIRKEFSVVADKSVDKRETEPEKFGYYAFNLVCTHAEKRKIDVQFKKYANLWFEIQVTSVLRHAWSEIEHPWYDLKDEYPDGIKRKFYRLAALLEMAEEDFQRLRDEKLNYRRSVGVRVEAEVPDVPIDNVSMRTFISADPIVADLDRSIASVVERSLNSDLSEVIVGLRVKAAREAGFASLLALRDSLRKYQRALPEYVERAHHFWEQSPTAPLHAGFSIFHHTMMLAAARGAEKLAEVRAGIGVAGDIDLAKVAAIAADVVRKY